MAAKNGGKDCRLKNGEATLEILPATRVKRRTTVSAVMVAGAVAVLAVNAVTWTATV